ncbi:cysteine--tRNA ligase [Mycoplasma sp. CB776]
MKEENIYLCGPTVYNHVHIGNMRSLVFIDILNRVKKYFNYQINYLHNITDIDDKIIQKAIEENKSEKEISEFYYQEYLKLFKIYNIVKPTKILKITDKLDWIKNYIKELLDNKNAYKSEGNVFFDVKTINNYGSLSNRKLEDMKNEEDNSLKKKNIQDFSLWKNTELGIKYDSEFGQGRPGWHTECCAMIYYYFNKKTIDIHAGGVDLLFPHHENENAQHFALTNKAIAKEWIHAGFINKNGYKMSKSLGNILLAKDFAFLYGPDTFRNIILTTNIFSPVDLSDELIISNKNKIQQLTKSYYQFLLEKSNLVIDTSKIEKIMQLFLELKFAQANKEISKIQKNKDFATLFEIYKLLGFNYVNLQLDQEIKEIYYKWKELKEQKKYDQADKLRVILYEKNIL